MDFSRYIVYVNISDTDTGDNGMLEKITKRGMYITIMST